MYASNWNGNAEAPKLMLPCPTISLLRRAAMSAALLATRLHVPAISPPSGTRALVPFFSRIRFLQSHCSEQIMSISTDSLSPLPSDNGDGVTPEVADSDVLVQYVVLRRDLIDSWPLGSVVTQGCHASVAAIWTHSDDSHTVEYCSPSNIDSMHKVTLEVKGETQILNLSEKLNASGIAHKLWIEQPENIPTCLATKPYPKSAVSSFFKRLKLCK